LSEANLEETDLRGANLAGANLTRANLLCAELEGANLEGVSLSQACLIGTSEAKVSQPLEQVKIPLKIVEIEHTSKKTDAK
jgi:uncharacterized protein YjbI with pentapeptide repeats